jgi:hypothetical protein
MAPLSLKVAELFLCFLIFLILQYLIFLRIFAGEMIKNE